MPGVFVDSEEFGIATPNDVGLALSLDELGEEEAVALLL